MSDQSNKPQDQFENKDKENSATLEISVDKDGSVGYNVNWKEGDEGLLGIASIFYKLIVDNLPEQILEGIKQDCISKNEEFEYMAIIEIVNKLSKVSINQNNTGDDNIVVPPDQIFSI
jgi:hypothetical protein